MRDKTEQEVFWEGSFGDAYNERNRVSPDGRVPFFRHIVTGNDWVIIYFAPLSELVAQKVDLL